MKKMTLGSGEGVKSLYGARWGEFMKWFNECYQNGCRMRYTAGWDYDTWRERPKQS